MKADLIYGKGNLSEESLKYIMENKILAFNAENIDSSETLRLAVYHADQSFKKGTNFAKDYNLEIMLYLSGNKQIDMAKKIFGINRETRKIVIISSDKKILQKLGLEPDNALEEKISNRDTFEKMVLLKLKK